MKLKSVFEFRGYDETITQKGKKLITLNFEGANGTGYSILTTNDKVVAELKRGNKYLVAFDIQGSAFLSSVSAIKE